MELDAFDNVWKRRMQSIHLLYAAMGQNKLQEMLEKEEAMNQREAEEIVSQFKDAQYILKDVHPNAKAYFLGEGYLECMAHAQTLVQALSQIRDREEYSCECVGDPCSCDFSFMQWTAEQALKLWDAAQGKSK